MVVGRLHAFGFLASIGAIAAVVSLAAGCSSAAPEDESVPKLDLGGVGPQAAGGIPGKPRCSTRDLSGPEQTADHAKMALLSPDGQTLQAVHAPGSITIPVHFHVINQGSGIANGDVPDSQLA